MRRAVLNLFRVCSDGYFSRAGEEADSRPARLASLMSADAAVTPPGIKRAAISASSLRRDNRSSMRMRGSDPGALLTSSKDLQGRIGKLCEQLNRSLALGVASATERGVHTELLSAKEDMDRFFQGLHAAVTRIAAAENAPVSSHGRMHVCCPATPQIPAVMHVRACEAYPCACAHADSPAHGPLQEIEREVQRQKEHNRALSSQLAEAAAALRDADSRVRCTLPAIRDRTSACSRSDLSIRFPSIGGCAAGAAGAARGTAREPALRLLPGADAARLLRGAQRCASAASHASNGCLLL